MLPALPLSPLPVPRPRVLAGALLAAVSLHGLLAWCLMIRLPMLPGGLPARAVTTSVVLAATPATPAPIEPLPRPPVPLEAAALQALPAPAARAATPQTAAGFSWRYLLIQGERRGTAQFSWRPGEGQYEALLERELEGKALPTWRSQGELDPDAGLAPRRFAQRLQGRHGPRDRQATNFRRDEGLVSYSASPALQPLQEGTQDRISWWLQLAALIEAEPRRYPGGSELVMPVAGLRGELQAWRFKVKGLEAVDLPAGRLEQALRLEREALGAWDGRIELWLDPARHHLPVRVRHTQGELPRWELLLQGEDKLLPP